MSFRFNEANSKYQFTNFPSQQNEHRSFIHETTVFGIPLPVIIIISIAAIALLCKFICDCGKGGEPGRRNVNRNMMNLSSSTSMFPNSGFHAGEFSGGAIGGCGGPSSHSGGGCSV
ncbi:UNVERIFIED_CONTAM: hypothetical protein RMT77_018849 [Armadillidium vulgare]